MKAQIFSTAAVLTVFCGTLPAADPRLLNLVMPDAKILAGVNVAQARTSPFGQYILSQIQNQAAGFDQLAALTGFDPRRDVSELLAASNSNPHGSGALVLATGTFNPAVITAFAMLRKGVTENYQGVTIVEDPKQTFGIAFLGGSLAAAGDLANVKAAIDRQASPSVLPAAVAVQINQLSGANDAWVLTTVPPSTLKPPSGGPALPGLGGNSAGSVLNNIQQAGAGVKFGANVTFTAQAQADTAQNATAIAGVLQLLANLAQLQAQQNPQAAALAKSLLVTANGVTVNISASVPADQFQQLLQPNGKAVQPHIQRRK